MNIDVFLNNMTDFLKHVMKQVHIGPKYDLTGASGVRKRVDLKNDNENLPNLDLKAKN